MAPLHLKDTNRKNSLNNKPLSAANNALYTLQGVLVYWDDVQGLNQQRCRLRFAASYVQQDSYC